MNIKTPNPKLHISLFDIHNYQTYRKVIPASSPSCRVQEPKSFDELVLWRCGVFFDRERLRLVLGQLISQQAPIW
ncbi:hypothetical protein HI914_02080 [Erysiphe necator]|uniref:Uncharacterized protein n=1 Tax=Uncinula necator TaxID=52586 RepID=A0A0B1P7F7_UNCNE|nr:hypothetical protein HI914_02080 [Erysiphe necator]KHJ34637.1 hypothetical protein EV44_g1742 [Erysiphe necator]